MPFVVPERVPWRMMYNTLNSKFTSEVQTSHNLDQYNQHFLAQKIFNRPDFADDFSNMSVSWAQFNKVQRSAGSPAQTYSGRYELKPHIILNLAGGPSWSAVHILAVVRGSDGAYQEASEDLLEQGVRSSPLWFVGMTHLLHSGHNKCLQCFESTRLIFGFIGKQHLHLILKDRPNGTFLLRFSDSEIGGITIAYVSATESRCRVSSASA